MSIRKIYFRKTLLLQKWVILFLGETYESARKPMEFAGMQFMNANTFYQIQRNLVIPSVNKVYNKSIAAAREEVRDKDTVIEMEGLTPRGNVPSTALIPVNPQVQIKLSQLPPCRQ